MEEVGGVSEESGLFCDGGEPSRVAVTQCIDSNARGKVQILFAVCVVHFGALAADKDDVRASVGLQDVTLFVGDDLLGEACVCGLQALRGLHGKGVHCKPRCLCLFRTV